MSNEKQLRVPKIIELSSKDPDLEAKLKEISKKMHAGHPAASEKLRKILTRRGFLSMKQFLRKIGYGGIVPDELLPFFMDWLIIQRQDMKGFHPEARTRLRDFWLGQQDEKQKTEDYIQYVEGQEYPHDCGNCLWFMIKPEDEEKTCVERGSKGLDKACYGFTRNPNK